MPDTSEESRPRLTLDHVGYAERERLVAYEIGNTLLMLNLELQKNFGLRAEAPPLSNMPLRANHTGAEGNLPAKCCAGR